MTCCFCFQACTWIFGDSRIFDISGAGEHARQRVVILLRKRIVFVVVTARASHRESEKAACHRIDPFVALVSAALHRLSLIPDPRRVSEKCGAGNCFPRFLSSRSPGELRLHEPVVRHVVVERLNHPVAKNVRALERHVAATLGIEAAHIVLGVTCDIQPMTSPAFAIARRSQQTVHHFCVCIRRMVVDEGVDFFWRWRQAGQIQRRAPDERLPIRRRNRLQSRGVAAWLEQSDQYLYWPTLSPGPPAALDPASGWNDQNPRCCGVT